MYISIGDYLRPENLTKMSSQSTHKSKNGLDILIRPALVSDASALLKLKLGYLRNTTTIPLFVDEYKNTTQDEETFISKIIKEQNSHLLVAEHKGELIGNIDINGNQRRKLFHTAMLGMGISYKWHGLGIGTILMKEAMKSVQINKHLKIIWLEVYDTNLAGKRLYVKSGFKECGRIKGFFEEGEKSIDNIKMVRHF